MHLYGQNLKVRPLWIRLTGSMPRGTGIRKRRLTISNEATQRDDVIRILQLWTLVEHNIHNSSSYVAC